MAPKTILETERLLLREFDEADIETFYLLGSDPAIIRYTGDPGGGMTSIEHALEILRANPLADYKKHGFGRWACVHKESSEVIGFAGLKYMDERDEVDIGYRLLPQYWGAGFATEAASAALDFGFRSLQLKEIIGLAVPDNAASIRVLEKLGMGFVEMVDYFGLQAAKYVIKGPRNS
jgi:RimJ/RimL family protein N-acetyltransferase